MYGLLSFYTIIEGKSLRHKEAFSDDRIALTYDYCPN